MKKFAEFLSESTGKNTHMDHVEELIFKGGVTGTRKAILFLKDLRNMLAGSAKKEVDITIKFDGCIHEDTIILSSVGDITVKELISRFNAGEEIKVMGKDLVADFNYNHMVNVIGVSVSDGEKAWVEVELTDGSKFKLTHDHEVHTTNGWKAASELKTTDKITELYNNEKSLKVARVTELNERYTQYDISTDTENFYIQTLNGYVLIHNSPAIFVGVDPEDNQFFVAKKGLFNKTPKMYKTQADIDEDLDGDLAEKFSVALSEFSKLGINKGVFQGDLMFTKSDLRTETHNSKKYVTFQPNTIVYAVPTDSDLGKKISKSKIGVVWHTTYTGPDLQSMSASFGEDIASKFKRVPTIWQEDATYRDISGKAAFTQSETKQFDALLSNADKQFKKIKGDALETIINDSILKQKVLTYLNTYVRAGSKFPDARKITTGLVTYLEKWFETEIGKKKSDKGKATWMAKRDDTVKKVISNKNQLIAIFGLMNTLVEAKSMVIDQLDRAQEIDTLLRTKNGLVVTKQEGFVAINKLQGGAVKLVDRLEFSKANFSPEIIKGWQR